MLSDHLGCDAIEDYLLKRLDRLTASDDAVEEHLLICEDCRCVCAAIEEQIARKRASLASLRARHPGKIIPFSSADICGDEQLEIGSDPDVSAGEGKH